MGHRGTLKERGFELAVGWLCAIFYVYTIMDGVRSAGRSVSVDLSQVGIITHSCAPVVSVALWVATTLFGILTCILLIIGLGEYAASFSWFVVIPVPILACLSALATTEPARTDVDGVIATLFYFAMMALALLVFAVAHAARRREIVYRR